MYDIGLAIPADAGTIADISKKCFSSPWDEKSVAGDIASDHAIVLSAGTSGRIVGYAICYLGGDQADLVSIAVLPEHRRGGLGHELLKELEKECAAGRIESVFLEVRISNEAAIGLYENNGFDRIGVRKAYYNDTGEDAILMRKDIHA
jgi:ribosomal-protein-alanine N-acetyltransferase